MNITSRAFKEGVNIPSEYTCNGEGLNPPLLIDGIPEGAKSLTIIMEDLDSSIGVWDHWVKFNIGIESDAFYVEEGEEPEGMSGKNTAGTLMYYGPCPHEGAHRYLFRVYAVDKALDCTNGTTKEEILRDMEGHIVEEAQLMGVYSKPK